VDYFSERLLAASRQKNSVAVLGIDPQLTTSKGTGVPAAQTLAQFCCTIVEACAKSIVAIKPQLAFFEARGLDGMRTLMEVLATARRVGLLTIADAKRGDIGSTSEAYAEAFLGSGDFACDAVTVNPYLGSDSIAPFVARVRAGRGLFVLVKTSNPSSGEFQDRVCDDARVWEWVARRVEGWGSDFVGPSGLSPVGAVIGATYPEHAKRARELMPHAMILVPGYGAQGATADDAVRAARPDGLGVVVNASRSLMYAYEKRPGTGPGEAAAAAAEAMRVELNAALDRRRAGQIAGKISEKSK
jgi:orotidine-5'-phosphate decarboxylase